MLQRIDFHKPTRICLDSTKKQFVDAANGRGQRRQRFEEEDYGGGNGLSLIVKFLILINWIFDYLRHDIFFKRIAYLS